MTDPSPPELPEHVRTLIEAERRRPDLSTERVRRIREGVERAIERRAPGNGPPRGSRGWGRAGWIGVGVAIGIALHAGWVALTAQPGPVADARSAGAAGRAEPEAPGPPVMDAPPEPEPVVRTDAPPAEARVSGPRARTEPEDALHRERVLVDRARVAIREGRSAAALTSSRRHAREFPAGALVEERLAIEARALLALGRPAEARARFDELTLQFPRSLHRNALAVALAEGAPPPPEEPSP